MSARNGSSRTLLKIAAVVLVAAAVAVFAFQYFRPIARVQAVRRDKAADSVTGSVIVHADKDLQDIKSEMPGRVSWIDPRQLGQPFKAGEKIVELDSTDLRRQMKEAEDAYNAKVERLKIQKKDDKTLDVAKDALAAAERRHQRGEISEDDYKAAQRAFDAANTALALNDFDAKQAKTDFDVAQGERQRELDKMTIRMPVDGVLKDVMVAKGALISAGSTVATYYANQRVVIAQISEDDISKVKVGQPAIVRLLNVGNQNFDAKVVTILPYAQPDTQRYSVYLEVHTALENLKPFSNGEATITVAERPNSPVIPRRALFNDEFVFVVKNGVVEKRHVDVGFKALNFAEVTKNLEAGEYVIVDDVDQFRDGQHVKTEIIK